MAEMITANLKNTSRSILKILLSSYPDSVKKIRYSSPIIDLKTNTGKNHERHVTQLAPSPPVFRRGQTIAEGFGQGRLTRDRTGHSFPQEKYPDSSPKN